MNPDELRRQRIVEWYAKKGWDVSMIENPKIIAKQTKSGKLWLRRVRNLGVRIEGDTK